MGERLGLLGGTYDPPHVGHLIVAQDVVERLELDRLLVVPAGDPPHRDVTLPASVRYDLVEAAFGPDPRFEVSDLELRRDGTSYTVDTLEEIVRRRDPAELYCVIGVDQLDDFGSWHRPERIVEVSTLAVMNRGAREPPPSTSESPFPYRTLEVTRVGISSTDLRRRLREDRSVRYLVPESVRGRLLEAWRRHGRRYAAERRNETGRSAY